MAKTGPGNVIGTVTRKAYITPHYIRFHFKADDIQRFENTTIGDNNKIAVPPEGLNEVYMPRFDEAKHEWIHPPKEVAPAIRTYTHRGIDLEKGELIIDFVNHGDNGPASRWALQAETGSRLGIMMRTEAKTLYPPAEWYLLAGDATAIPVLSAILESLPEEVKGICIIEVHGKEDEQLLQTRAAFDFVWLHNPHPENGSGLAAAVKQVQAPQSSRFGYVAAEFSSVKDIRTYLRKELGWEQSELYAYSYWKAGVAEDKSQADRRQEREEV